MSDEHASLRADGSDQGDARSLLSLAREQEAAGNLRFAATAYDRAFGLAPEDKEIASARAVLLDRLSVTELGLRFRYVPAGAFLMGSEAGDPDEQPVHLVELGEYWITETPLSWVDYCRLMGWKPPPEGLPQPQPPRRRLFRRAVPDEEQRRFMIFFENKIRLQYCEDATLRAAHDWIVHQPEEVRKEIGWTPEWSERVGKPEREDPLRSYTYSEKPVVGTSWHRVQELCARISTVAITYRLPTEAEWEKAARGGLIGARYPWGSDPPSPDRCDFNRFEQFALQPSRRFPPNGYGLYAMSGSVWEWTADWYDAQYYGESPRLDPEGPPTGEQKVLRGGSWADCADALTVSFRMSRKPEWAMIPNIGFRLCRIERR